MEEGERRGGSGVHRRERIIPSVKKRGMWNRYNIREGPVIVFEYKTTSELPSQPRRVCNTNK